METKVIKVSKATTNLMQTIERLQDAYFEMCEALENKGIETDDLVKPWNTINELMWAKIGLHVMETFGETGNRQI